jgi:hypothetical protein
MDSADALRIAKCIVEALTAAGLKIVPADIRKFAFFFRNKPAKRFMS